MTIENVIFISTKTSVTGLGTIALVVEIGWNASVKTGNVWVKD